MAYTTDKINWAEDDTLTPGEMNRLESNVKALHEESVTFSGNKTFSGNNTHSGNSTFTGTFIAAGVSTTGAGTTISSVNANGSDTTGTTFTITKTTSFYGEFNTTSATGSYSGFVQANINSTYTDEGGSVLPDTGNIAAATIISTYRFHITLGPGTYRLFIKSNGTGAVTLSLKQFGIFGASTV